MNSIRFSRVLLPLLACGLIAVHSSVRAQIINGSFETGNFSGWTVIDPSNFSLVSTNPIFAHTGISYASLGAKGALGSLSQSFNTVSGGVYNLSFAPANDATKAVNQFSVFWNGTQVLNLTNVPNSNYMIFSINNLTATSGTSSLEFRYRNDSEFFRLDTVNANLVPEPSTVSLALFGLGSIAALAVRRVKARRIS